MKLKDNRFTHVDSKLLYGERWNKDTYEKLKKKLKLMNISMIDATKLVHSLDGKHCNKKEDLWLKHLTMTFFVFMFVYGGKRKERTTFDFSWGYSNMCCLH